MTNIVEIVAYQLLPNASEAAFYQANEEFQRFVDEQPGVMYRSLTKKQGEERSFVDVAYFENIDATKPIQEAFANNPVCLALMEFIDNESVSMAYHDIQSQTPMPE